MVFDVHRQCKNAVQNTVTVYKVKQLMDTSLFPGKKRRDMKFHKDVLTILKYIHRFYFVQLILHQTT